MSYGILTIFTEISKTKVLRPGRTLMQGQDRGRKSLNLAMLSGARKVEPQKGLRNLELSVVCNASQAKVEAVCKNQPERECGLRPGRPFGQRS